MWLYIVNIFIRLDLLSDIISDNVARNMHQRITVVGVNAHARQAGEMVVQQAGLFLSFIGRQPDQAIGNEPGASADRISVHAGGGNSAGLRIHRQG